MTGNLEDEVSRRDGAGGASLWFSPAALLKPGEKPSPVQTADSKPDIAPKGAEVNVVEKMV